MLEFQVVPVEAQPLAGMRRLAGPSQQEYLYSMSMGTGQPAMSTRTAGSFTTSSPDGHKPWLCPSDQEVVRAQMGGDRLPATALRALGPGLAVHAEPVDAVADAR
jgi:hypothetical protein